MQPDNHLARLLKRLLPLVCSLVLVIASPYTQAKAASASLSTVFLPPPVTLEYAVRVKYTAMSLGGRSSIEWDHTDKTYTVKTRVNCNMLGTILITTSEGRIGQQGLKPDLFTEKRRNRDEARTVFDWNNKTLTFSASGHTLPFKEGIQDRDSIVWQFVSLARANPEKLAAGRTLSFMLSSKNGINQWDFTAKEAETLLTQLGEIKTVCLIGQDKKGKTIEVWLAPDMNWYPIKLIFSDNKDLRLEQIIKKITPR